MSATAATMAAQVHAGAAGNWAHPRDNLGLLEWSVVGAVLVDPGVLSELPDLAVTDFRDLRCQIAFAAMRQLEAVGKPIDLGLVLDEVARAGKAAAVEADWLAATVVNAPSTLAVHVVEYAAQIRSAATGRRLVEVLSECLTAAKAGEERPEDVIAMATSGLAELDRTTAQAGQLIGEVLDERMAQIELVAQARARGERLVTGCSTGIDELDEFLGGGIPIGLITVIGGRPGMGKSAFGLTLAIGAVNGGHGVHVFSLEDARNRYADRVLARLTGIDSQRIASARLDAAEVAAIARARAEMRKAPLILDDSGGLSIDDVIRRMRRSKKRNGTRLAILDYINLVSDKEKDQHKSITNSMKALAASAKSDDLAWVVMAQLNRQVESRVDRRPQLADLRESGSLEEQAKVVIAPYRGAYYGPQPKRGIDYHCDVCAGSGACAHAPTVDEFSSTVQLMVLKQGNGASCSVRARWHGPTTNISNW